MRYKIFFLSNQIKNYLILILICFVISSFADIKFQSLNIFNLTKKANFLISLSKFPELSSCFFRNGFIYDQELFSILSTSGLLHLTAISGGQTQIAIALFTKWPLYFIARVFRHYIGISSLFFYFSKILAIMIFFVSGFLTLFFGMSGSLQRVWILRYMLSNKIFFTVSKIVSTRYPHLSRQLIRRACGIFIICCIFGNAWLNLSFLLSACGSATASLIANGRRIHIKNRILKIGVQNALCSITISIFIFPFAQTNIIGAALANIIAVPLVDIFLVPWGLCLLFLPLSKNHLIFGMKVFDFALEQLLKVAHLFANTNAFYEKPAWPLWSFYYLGALTITLWSVQDYHDDSLRRRLLCV